MSASSISNSQSRIWKISRYAELHAAGCLVNHKKVMGLMREHGLSVRPRKRFVITTAVRRHVRHKHFAICIYQRQIYTTLQRPNRVFNHSPYAAAFVVGKPPEEVNRRLHFELTF